jgi:hypothetical protein
MSRPTFGDPEYASKRKEMEQMVQWSRLLALSNRTTRRPASCEIERGPRIIWCRSEKPIYSSRVRNYSGTIELASLGVLW